MNYFNRFIKFGQLKCALLVQARRGYLGVAVAWALLQCLFAGLGGGRFLSDTQYYWQMIDIALLRERFAETLWYYHANPPLFNVYRAAVDLLPGPSGLWHQAAFMAMGLLSALLLYGLLCGAVQNRRLAFILSLLVLLSPAWWMMQHWLMYTFPVMALLTAVFWFLQRLAPEQRACWGWGLAASLAALGLLRALFHPVWMLMLWAWLLWRMPQRRRAIMVWAAASLLAVCAWSAKNGVVFGLWAGSSWLGPNLYHMTERVSPLERQALIEAGALSPVASVRPFSGIEAYREVLGQEQRWNAPVLVQQRKADGSHNYNHSIYLRANQCYGRDALVLIAHAPVDYAAKVGQSLKRFGQPPWTYHRFTPQSETITRGLAWLNHRLLGFEDGRYQAQAMAVKDRPRWTLLHGLYAVLLVGGLGLAARGGKAGLSPGQRTVLECALITIGWVAFTALFFMPFENYRLGFVLTPCWALLAALLAVMLLRQGSWFASKSMII